MTAPTPIQLYVVDAAFTNRAAPTPPFFRSAGGIAQLSSRALSYFETPYIINDPRDPSARNVLWAPETSAAILVDNTLYADFITNIASAASSTSEALFAIIDALAFNYNANTPAATIEAYLVGTPALAICYGPGSLVIGPATAVGSVYEGNNTTQSVTVPTKASFVFNILVGGQTFSYAITAWLENTTFLASYANSNILQVVPPVNYNDLLNLPFSSTVAAMANDASIASFTQPLINTAIQSAEPSGYAQYVAKVIDGTGSLNMAFNVLYAGQVPTFAAMRVAIRTAVENSGFGTPDLWKARIPELYVESRIYLIPIWDQKIAVGSGTLYSGIASPGAMLAKATSALGSTDASSLVNQHGEFLTAAYNLLPIVASPDSVNQPADSLETLYPTYQALAPTDSSFVYMSSDAQAFATMLNAALPVAAGTTTNASYPIIVDGLLTYVSFTQNLTEFCILTKAFYNQQLGVSS